jgi:hypothetical protein
MAVRAGTPQGRKLSDINNMPHGRFLPSMYKLFCTFFYVSVDWTNVSFFIILSHYRYTGCLTNGAQSLTWLRYLKSRVKFGCQFFFLWLVSKLYEFKVSKCGNIGWYAQSTKPILL